MSWRLDVRRRYSAEDAKLRRSSGVVPADSENQRRCDSPRSGTAKGLISCWAHHDLGYQPAWDRSGLSRVISSIPRRAMPGSTVQGQAATTSKLAGIAAAAVQLELECQVDARFESRGAQALLT